MIVLGFVALAGLGAVVRAYVTDLSAPFDRQMWGTMAVNVVGSFLLGALSGASTNAIVMVGVGGLGAMTTFSTFVAQIECIHREGTSSNALMYAAGTVILSVAAAWLGWSLV